MVFTGREEASRELHWKVLLAGLAEHHSLIDKLSQEGHEIQATHGLVEACLCIASDSYDLIIIDADGRPAHVAAVCEWLAQGSSGAVVIVLTNWRSTAGTPVSETDSSPK